MEKDEITIPQNEKTKNRNIKIDIIKGVAIFLVLWGHYIQYTSANQFDYFQNGVFKVIYSFHMPLFALISGYLCYGTVQRKKLKEIVYSRISGLLLPILVWGTIRWLFCSIVQRSITLEEWHYTFTGSFLWFLWSTLAISLCLAIIMKKVPNQLQPIAIIIGFFVMYLFPNPEMNLYMYPFFVIGFYGAKYKEKLEPYRRSKYRFVIILIFMVLLCFFKKKSYIYLTGITIGNSRLTMIEQIIVDGYRYTIGLLGSISVILIVDTIVGIKGKIVEKIKKCFIDCGKYSMQIYILQAMLLEIYAIDWKLLVSRMGQNILAKNMILYSFIITPILAIVTILAILVLTKKIEKNKKVSKVLFGR